MNVNAVWVARFADIPGVRYETPAGIDVAHLPGRGEVPAVRFNEYTGHNHLSWKTPDGATSRSPAGQLAFHDDPSMASTTSAQLLIRIAHALELPGEPSDYHLALQGAATFLYGRRRSEPAMITEVHRLYSLDLQLIQALPDTVSLQQDGQQRYFAISALARLLRMYLTEGRIADAVKIADIAERFGAGSMADVADARSRAAALGAEDAS